MLAPFRVARAAILFGFVAVIVKLFLTGEMVKYMSPSLDPLTALAGVVLALMGTLELLGSAEHHHAEPEHGLDESLAWLLLVVPIALGLFFAPRALGGGALGGERLDGLLLSFGAGPAPLVEAQPPPSWPLGDVDELLAYVSQTGEAGIGQRVRVRGIAMRSGAFRDDELALLRFSIAHCVADARPVVLLVVMGTGGSAPLDRWVEIEGVLDRRERDGDRLISVVADSIVPIEEPDNPYLSAL